jgi:hypothetical protein
VKPPTRRLCSQPAELAKSVECLCCLVTIPANAEVEHVLPCRYQLGVKGDNPSECLQSLGPVVPYRGSLVIQRVSVEEPGWPVVRETLGGQSITFDSLSGSPLAGEEGLDQEALALGKRLAVQSQALLDSGLEGFLGPPQRQCVAEVSQSERGVGRDRTLVGQLGLGPPIGAQLPLAFEERPECRQRAGRNCRQTGRGWFPPLPNLAEQPPRRGIGERADAVAVGAHRDSFGDRCQPLGLIETEIEPHIVPGPHQRPAQEAA